MALTLDPKPAVPDEAAVDAAKGKTIFASANSPVDMKAAAAAFVQASQLAPWVPDYYYNEGLALEKAKQFDGAIHAWNFYLLAAPNATDANDVKGRIEGIQFEEEKVAKFCKDFEDTKRAAYDGIGSSGEKDVDVLLASVERPTYLNNGDRTLILNFKDMTRSVPADLGNYGWTVNCPPQLSQACSKAASEFTAGAVYQAHVSGYSLISVTSGTFVLRLEGVLYQDVWFFPAETKSRLASCP